MVEAYISVITIFCMLYVILKISASTLKTNMKKLTFLAFMLVSVLFCYSQTKNFIDQPYIEVSGTADTLVTPNEIYISIVLSEKDTRDRIPMEEQEQKMVTALKSLGLNPEEDLTTSDMTSNFKFYLLKSKDVIKTKVYILKVTDATTASQVFIKLEEIGISNTSIERVDHSDLDNLKNAMRTKAIIDAKKRAVALTAPLIQYVGSAINITDSESMSQKLEGRAPGIQIREMGFQANFKELPRIEFEKIKVEARVNAKFVLN